MKGNIIYKRDEKEIGRSSFDCLEGLLKLIVDLIPEDGEIVCELELDAPDSDEEYQDLASMGQQKADAE